MITIIALMGKTSSGKDTVAKYLKKKYGIEPVISYTDRSKRPSETNGIEHWFADKKEMDRLWCDYNSLLAFTRFPKTGIRYLATTEGLEDGKVYSYIINPDAVKQMRERRKDINVHTVYVDLPEDEIRKRATVRGDSGDEIEKRLDSEREQFDSCLQSGDADVVLSTNKSPEEVEKDVDSIMEFFRKLDENRKGKQK